MGEVGLPAQGGGGWGPGPLIPTCCCCWCLLPAAVDAAVLLYCCCVQAADGNVLIGGLSGRSSSRPKNTLPLLTSTVKMDAEDPGMRCCFRWVGVYGGCYVGGRGRGGLAEQDIHHFEMLFFGKRESPGL